MLDTAALDLFFAAGSVAAKTFPLQAPASMAWRGLVSCRRRPPEVARLVLFSKPLSRSEEEKTLVMIARKPNSHITGLNDALASSTKSGSN